MKKLIVGSVIAAAASALAGCTNSPGSPSVSFVSPTAGGPANGTAFKFKGQPVTLTINNAVRTGVATATYAVEVATDSGFATKVYTQNGIAEGPGGTTPVTIAALPASGGNQTYYWRSTATVDGVASPASSAQSFVIQQQIVVSAPTLSSPASGSTVSQPRPTFVVNNAKTQGAVGKITYIYQVSTSSSFSSILMTSPAVAEGSGQTAWTPTSDLPLTVFWRVQAKDDTNGEASSFTSGFSLTVQPFDPTKAIFIYNPPDLGSWPQTSTITYIEFGDGIFSFDFDRRDGNNAWPDVGFGSDGSLEYTLGLCEQINNQWYCSAAIQYWNGRDPYVTSDIAGNWFYDPQRWGILAGRQPQDGELVAIYVAQGNLRGPGYTYQERSDFVVMPWGGSYHRH